MHYKTHITSSILYHMKNLRILSILDDFTYHNLKLEANVELLTKKPLWYSKYNKIDFLLVESAWRGNNNSWRHKIASYPEHPKRNISDLRRLVNWCKSKNIPTVFWNKEDPYHYDQFIEAANLFDYIFTTDQLSISRYRLDAPHSQCHPATFFIQPKLHYKSELPPLKRTLFMRTYQKNMHDARTEWQNQIFKVAAPYGLDLYNRHLNQGNYKFPNFEGDIQVFPSASYTNTANIYRQYQQILNVNTITQSPTMFSRRLIEIMACGRLAISNPSLSIQHLFKDMCIEISTEDSHQNIFEQLKFGYTLEQKQIINYAYEHVHQHYTAQNWLKRILNTCQIDHPFLNC